MNNNNLKDDESVVTGNGDEILPINNGITDISQSSEAEEVEQQGHEDNVEIITTIQNPVQEGQPATENIDLIDMGNIKTTEAKIFKLLMGFPEGLTYKEIQKKLNLTSRPYNNIKKLVNKGFVISSLNHKVNPLMVHKYDPANRKWLGGVINFVKRNIMPDKDKIEGWFWFILFIGTIFGSNYLLNHIGTICPPNSPCLIPVWIDVYSPSGVLAAGLSFTFRDLVQRKLGVKYTILAIIIGAIVSGFLSPKLAMASFTAFLISETADLSVYTPLRNKGLIIAVICSNIVGLIADSCIFLYLAFGNLQYLEGQIIGKVWMTVLALPMVWFICRNEMKKARVENLS